MIFDSVKRIISQQKEIDRLRKVADCYASSARSIALNLDKFCDRSLPYSEMIAVAARKASQRIIDLEDDNKALESVVDSFTDIGKMYSEIRSEAVKDFAKLLVDKAENGVVSIADLPDYVKEMVGEG